MYETHRFSTSVHRHAQNVETEAKGMASRVHRDAGLPRERLEAALLSAYRIARCDSAVKDGIRDPIIDRVARFAGAPSVSALEELEQWVANVAKLWGDWVRARHMASVAIDQGWQSAHGDAMTERSARSALDRALVA